MHKKVSEIHRQKAELSEQHLAHILWLHSWIMWITELHHCAFVAIVAGKKKKKKCNEGQWSGFCALCHYKGFHAALKEGIAARDRRDENGKLERAGNHVPARSMAWGWQKLPGVTAVSHKSSLRISRTADSEQTSSERIKKQRQLAKYNQNSTKCCDT